jgi:hypothetical protein
MPPAPRIRPYKDFLTPLMHRRFAGATAILAFLCYVESVIIGEKNSGKSPLEEMQRNQLNLSQLSGHGFHLE